MPRTLNVEADGGSRGNPGPAGYGAVVRDPATAEALAEVAEYLGVATNNVAEYRGLIAGLRAARAIDPQALIEVHMDSKLVVEQMTGRWKIKHPDIRPLAGEARSVFPVGQVTYTWVPRERNKHADRLANEAMDAGQAGRTWQQRPATDESTPITSPVGWAPPDLGTPTEFLLLRHGETALTHEKRFSGSGGSDPDLSDRGRWQAERAAAYLAEGNASHSIQAIVTSPLARCRQTAEAVAARLGLDVRVEPDLRETDFGAWEGLNFAEVEQRYPGDLRTWLASPDVAPTGGESFAAVARRVAVSRDKLLARYPGRTALLVTHVTPIKTMVRLALGAPPETLFRIDLSAASFSLIQYYADGSVSLRYLNDTAHLRQGNAAT